MRHLYLCNTTSDKVDVINIDKFTIEKSIILPGVNMGRVGPHGLCLKGNLLLTSNCYDGSISIADLSTLKAESYYIGRYCRDICILGNHAYIICGDSNNTAIFDIITKDIIEIIPTGDSPHSIDCCIHNNKIVVANNCNDSITVFDSLYGSDIENIKVGSSPNKALFSFDGDYILVCESGADSYGKGCIRVISSNGFKLIYKIPVGICPFDMFCDKDMCYVSNYGDGTVTVIDMRTFKVTKTIHVGGMPRGIVSDGRYIYVGDSYNNRLIKVNVEDEKEKIIIPVSGQPTGMIIN